MVFSIPGFLITILLSFRCRPGFAGIAYDAGVLHQSYDGYQPEPPKEPLQLSKQRMSRWMDRCYCNGSNGSRSSIML